MARYKSSRTGSVIVTDAETAARMGSEWQPVDEPAADGYSAMKVADLKAEIERRNEGRDEADRLPTEGKKADLIAALEADDAAKE